MPTTHGKRRTGTYKSWLWMKERCYRTYHQAYPYYGGRGIKVCDRWLNSFENFLEDMGEREEGMTLDRIDPDGHYCPENCRWLESAKQKANRRCVHKIDVNGKEMTFKEIAEVVGVTPAAIDYRYRKRGLRGAALLEPKANNQYFYSDGTRRA